MNKYVPYQLQEKFGRTYSFTVLFSVGFASIIYTLQIDTVGQLI